MMPYRYSTDWTALLDDVFEAVLLHLWNDEVANVRLTCMAWRAKTDSLLQRLKTRHPELPALVQSFPGLCHLEIVAPTWQPQQLIYLSRLSRLRHLAVDTREVWGTSCEFRFDALRSCSGIVQLTLSGVQVDCAAGPKELPQLQCLALQGCVVGGTGLASLEWLSQLTRLEITGCTWVHTESLEGISRGHRLRSLSLAGTSGLSDSLLAELGNLLQLTSLDLGRRPIQARQTASITDAGLFHLSRLTNLRELSLAGCTVTDAGVAALCRSLQALESLDVSRPVAPAPMVSFPPPLTDASLIAVCQLPRLQHLRISEAHVGVIGCEALGRLSRLRSLSMSNCPTVTDASAFQLSLLTGLTELQLDRCLGLTNIGLCSLAAALHHLRALDLSGCHKYITDLGVQQIARHSTDLEVLRLACCDRVGQQGVASLRSLKALKHLDLSGCPGVTDESLRELSSSLHRLQILGIEYCLNITAAVLVALAQFPSLQDLRFCGSGLPPDCKLGPCVRCLGMVRQKRLWWML